MSIGTPQDGEYRVESVRGEDVMALVARLSDAVGPDIPNFVVELAAITLYGYAAGALRTSDEATRKKRLEWFVVEGADLLARLALSAKALSAAELAVWEQPGA